LVRCAGAKVVPLYDSDNVVQDAQRVLDTTPHCFGLNNNNRASKQLQQLGVPLLLPREVGRCIVDQRLPQDSTGKIIGRQKMVNVAESSKDDEGASDKKSPQDDGTKSMPASSQTSGRRVANSQARESSSTASQGTTSRKVSAQEPEGNSAASTSQSTTTNSRREKKSRIPAVAEPKDSGVSQKSTNRRGEETLDVEAMAADTSSSFDAPLADQEDSLNKEEEEEEPRVQPPKRSAETNTNDGSNKRQRLMPVARKGWLQAVPPKDKTRQAHEARSAHDDATEPCQVALTEQCQGLIVARPTTTAKRRREGPDFRSFRKNAIVTPLRRASAVLRSVLPKETEEQRDFDTEREALEEQQRRADELFRDPVRAGGRKRR
jgi:hypothetical protein